MAQEYARAVCRFASLRRHARLGTPPRGYEPIFWFAPPIPQKFAAEARAPVAVGRNSIHRPISSRIAPPARISSR